MITRTTKLSKNCFITISLLSLNLSTLFFAPLANAADIQQEPMLFFHEEYDTPELKLLLKEFDFDERIIAGKTEFEQMARLKDWVFYNVPFKHNYPKDYLKNAIKILSNARQGENFHCVHFATVYMQCALSLGWTSRYLFVQNIQAELHATNEIWSNQYKKWVMIDVTWNVHIEKAGLPLSLYEIRQEWQKNNGTDLVYVFGAGSTEKRYTHKDFPIKRDDNNAWRWWPLDEIFMTYSYEMTLVGRNDFFSSSDGNGANIYERMYIIKDVLNRNDEKWSFRRVQNLEDLKAFYHDVNRVDIEYEYVDWQTVLVKLNAFGKYNYTPNFKEYLVKLNKEEWAVQRKPFFWKLSPGSNTLQVKAVNKFGVQGAVYTLELKQ